MALMTIAIPEVNDPKSLYQDMYFIKFALETTWLNPVSSMATIGPISFAEGDMIVNMEMTKRGRQVVEMAAIIPSKAFNADATDRQYLLPNASDFALSTIPMHDI